VEARYSDNSTGSTFIPSGSTGSILIAFSDVQCIPAPECGEDASPTFESASVVPVSGSIGECCTTAPIQIAAIYTLAGGTDCTSGNSSDPFSNILWVEASWDGFVLNGSSKLVLDNGIGFIGSPTTYYSPLDPSVQISANSITTSTSGFIDPSAANDTYLVQEDSLLNLGGDNIDLSTDSSIPEVSFSVCTLL
jgi:hypothetical protein